jgi:hypothetical protein
MINKENRFDEYSYRIAFRELDPSVTTLEEGQWITLANNKIVISDGTKKSFLCISSSRPGRDQISGKPVKKSSYLLGAFEISVTNFDPTGTYVDMTPLVVTTGGILAPFVAGGDVSKIEAYAINAPVAGVLRICTK